MPKIADIAGASLFVFPNDHPPPHVHARYQGHIGRLRISDAACLDARADLPPRIMRAVGDWLIRHRDVAAAAWVRFYE